MPTEMFRQYYDDDYCPSFLFYKIKIYLFIALILSLKIIFDSIFYVTKLSRHKNL